MCAVLQQQSNKLRMPGYGSGHQGRPAGVVRAVDACACSEQNPADLLLALARGIHQRRCTAAILRIYIRLAADQFADCLVRARAGDQHQYGDAIRPRGVDICSLREKQIDPLGIPAQRREGKSRTVGTRCVYPGARAQKRLHHICLVGGGRYIERGEFEAVARIRIGSLLEQRLDACHIVVVDGQEKVLAPVAVRPGRRIGSFAGHFSLRSFRPPRRRILTATGVKGGRNEGNRQN